MQTTTMEFQHLSTLPYHNFNTAKYLLNEPGIDINKSDMYGQTPLHFACSRNNTEIIQLLCRNPALTSLNSRDVSGNTPIMVAAKFGNFQAFTKMMKIGKVDFSIRNIHGQTLTDIAE